MCTVRKNTINAHTTHPLSQTHKTVPGLGGPPPDLQATEADGRTALHIAAAKGHAGATQFLLAARCDPEARDGEGHTPLLLAAAQQGAWPGGGGGGGRVRNGATRVGERYCVCGACLTLESDPPPEVFVGPVGLSGKLAPWG